MLDPTHPSDAGNAAIFYHPEGYTIPQQRLMGRHVAGEGFLRGYARHAKAGALYAFARSQNDFTSFKQQVADAGGNVNKAVWLPQARPPLLAKPGALFLPGPDLAHQAYQRRFGDERAYSLTGITHTISSDRIMDAFGAWLTAPVHEWDAVVCIAPRAKAVVQTVLETYGEYLKERLNARDACSHVQLPVIPLGVDCEALRPWSLNPERRMALRQQHGIAEHDVAVLFVGRLSYHAKAHPLPMYLALEAAARKTSRRIHLIQAGWFANDAIEREFKEGAVKFCSGVRCLFLDGRDEHIKKEIWWAADIFTSLSDNIQETFSQTPMEAMAAGLPVVGTDWDGLCHSVQHGITGFLVPTAMPPASNGVDLALRYLTGEYSYDRYIGYASQFTAIDIASATEAFMRLIEDRELRLRMGAAGRARALSTYDWKVIVPQYQTLWEELAARREHARLDHDWRTRQGWPLRDDPFRVFASYQSNRLGAETRISLTQSDPLAVLDRLRSQGMNNYALSLCLPIFEIRALIGRIGNNGPDIGSLLHPYTDQQRPYAWRTLLWLAKIGLVSFSF